VLKAMGSLRYEKTPRYRAGSSWRELPEAGY
jgi:hypothetical protein